MAWALKELFADPWVSLLVGSGIHVRHSLLCVRFFQSSWQSCPSGTTGQGDFFCGGLQVAGQGLRKESPCAHKSILYLPIPCMVCVSSLCFSLLHAHPSCPIWSLCELEKSSILHRHSSVVHGLVI